jgi:site-specific DNA-methyltransferase (adenine-specific)
MSHKRNGDYITPKDEWQTPPELFKQLDDEFHFQLDAAATAQNRKCEAFFNKEVDALKVSWGKDSTFLNPPYSQGNIDLFMEKARIEGNQMAEEGYVVCLVPVASDTQWWHRSVMLAKEIRFIKGRVRFIGYDEDGVAIKNSPTFASCVVIFSDWHEHYWNQQYYRDEDGKAYLNPIIGKTIVQGKKV